MPRIRTIKPEFWRSPLIEELSLELRAFVELQPGVRHPWVGLPRGAAYEGFIYFLLGSGDEVLYVGRATTPQYRIPQHQRKPWWGRVECIAVFGFASESWRERDVLLPQVEAIAIDMHDPSCNVVKPSARLLDRAYRKGKEHASCRG